MEKAIAQASGDSYNDLNAMPSTTAFALMTGKATWADQAGWNKTNAAAFYASNGAAATVATTQAGTYDTGLSSPSSVSITADHAYAVLKQTPAQVAQNQVTLLDPRSPNAPIVLSTDALNKIFPN